MASATVLMTPVAAPAQQPPVEIEYTYDALGRMTRVVRDENGQTVDKSYDYDAAGNRTQVSEQGGSGGGGPTNNPPVAVDDSGSVQEGQTLSLNVRANDSDPDGDSLTITALTQPSYASASISGGSISVTGGTPPGGSPANTSFIYTISDGNGGTDSATVSLTVNPAPSGNNPPVANNDTGVSIESFELFVLFPLLNDTDPDGDTLSITAVTQSPHVLVQMNPDGVSLSLTGLHVTSTTPTSFTYTVSDGNGGTDTGTVFLTVEPQGGSCDPFCQPF